MLFRKKDTILKATNQERHDAIDRLITAGSMHSGYYMLLILATIIVTFGLLIENTSIVIGGMILAPLLTPILLLSLSLLNGTTRGCVESLKILFLSVVIAIVFSHILTYGVITYYSSVNYDHAIQPIGAGVYIMIALASGIAAAFAWVKENLAPSIAGVAVAVSLLPPLCTIGIGLALAQYDAVRESYLIFMSNLIGISAGAFVVFLLLGFMSTRKLQEKALNKENGD